MVVRRCRGRHALSCSRPPRLARRCRHRRWLSGSRRRVSRPSAASRRERARPHETVGIVWGAGGTIGTAQNIGDVLFLAAGLAWSGYTVAMRRARLDGLHAAAIAAAASFVLYLPVYAMIAGPTL